MPFRVTDVIQPANSEANKFEAQGFYQLIDSTDLNTSVAGFQSQLGINSGTDVAALSATGGYKFIVDNIGSLPSAIFSDIAVQGGVPANGDVIRVVREVYRSQRGYTFEVILDASNTGDAAVVGKDATTPFGTKGGLVYNAYDNKYYGFGGGTEWFEVGTGIKYSKGITAPTDPSVGEKWFETRTAIEFTYLGADEGWVAVNVAAGVTGSAGLQGEAGLTGPGYTGATIDPNSGNLLLDFLPEGPGGNVEQQDLGRVRGNDAVSFTKFGTKTSPLAVADRGLFHIIGASHDADPGSPDVQIEVQVNAFDGRSPSTDMTGYFDAALVTPRDGTLFISRHDQSENFTVLTYDNVSKFSTASGTYYSFNVTDDVLTGNSAGVSLDFQTAGITYNLYYVPKGPQGQQGEQGEQGEQGPQGDPGTDGGEENIKVFSRSGNIAGQDTDGRQSLGFQPLNSASTVKLSLSNQTDADGEISKVLFDVGGELNTGVTKDTNPNGWSSVSDYLARKVMILDETGQGTFDYIRVGDLFTDSEFGLQITDFRYGEDDYITNPTEGSTSILAPILQKSNTGGYTLGDANAPTSPFYGRYFKVSYGPFNVPSSTGGVTLSISTSNQAFIGDTQDYVFNTSVNEFDVIGGGMFEPLYLRLPNESNTTINLTVDVENDQSETASKNIPIKIGNYIHAGFTSANYGPGDIDSFASALASANAFENHEQSGGGDFDWQAKPENSTDYDMKSSINNTFIQYNWAASSEMDSSYFYLAFPDHWFGVESLQQGDVVISNAGSQADVVMIYLGTAGVDNNDFLPSYLTKGGSTAEIYSVFRSSQPGSRVEGQDGYIKFRVSTD